MNLIKTGMLLAALTSLFMVAGFLLGGMAGALIALVVAVGMNAYAFWNSDQLALKAHGARPVTRASAPELVGMVEELARNADMPMPAVYVIDSLQPNAFATGRSPDKAAVAATTGIMQMLSREELAGVMAHELAHIQNRDTLIMTVSATIAGAISMLAQFGMFFRGGRNNAMGMVGMLLAVFLAPMAAALIQMLISRTREYSADRLGGEICGNPLWLASALAKISGGTGRIEMASAERNPASAHLFIVNPLSGARFDNLFSTHPKAEHRIAALKQQAAEMGRTDRIAGVDTVATSQREFGPPRTGGPRRDKGPAVRRGPWK
ncbi:MAG: zinc metalloprotease HtpX [Paracoccaceae bacterium]